MSIVIKNCAFTDYTTHFLIANLINFYFFCKSYQYNVDNYMQMRLKISTVHFQANNYSLRKLFYYIFKNVCNTVTCLLFSLEMIHISWYLAEQAKFTNLSITFPLKIRGEISITITWCSIMLIPYRLPFRYCKKFRKLFTGNVQHSY